jgi:hypothetical protein
MLIYSLQDGVYARSGTSLPCRDGGGQGNRDSLIAPPKIPPNFHQILTSHSKWIFTTSSHPLSPVVV